MKRYTIKTEVTKDFSVQSMHETHRALSVVEESKEGEWVRWSDVEKLRESLESQIPEKRIERLEKALSLVTVGKCPECEQVVRGYKAPSGSFAPEAYAHMRENGINPRTGHSVGCSLGL